MTAVCRGALKQNSQWDVKLTSSHLVWRSCLCTKKNSRSMFSLCNQCIFQAHISTVETEVLWNSSTCTFYDEVYICQTPLGIRSSFCKIDSSKHHFNHSKMTSPSKIGISVAYMLLYCIQPELSLQALSLNVCFCMRGKKKSPFGNSVSFISHPYSNLDTFIIIFFTGISKGDTTFKWCWW